MCNEETTRIASFVYGEYIIVLERFLVERAVQYQIRSLWISPDPKVENEVLHERSISHLYENVLVDVFATDTQVRLCEIKQHKKDKLNEIQ